MWLFIWAYCGSDCNQDREIVVHKNIEEINRVGVESKVTNVGTGFRKVPCLLYNIVKVRCADLNKH